MKLAIIAKCTVLTMSVLYFSLCAAFAENQDDPRKGDSASDKIVDGVIEFGGKVADGLCIVGGGVGYCFGILTPDFEILEAAGKKLAKKGLDD